MLCTAFTTTYCCPVGIFDQYTRTGYEPKLFFLLVQLTDHMVRMDVCRCRYYRPQQQAIMTYKDGAND
jgi:hypothetical protein